ncbi:MAG: ComEA family DNA-binding protein [Flavobacteriaceae bacterium]
MKSLFTFTKQQRSGIFMLILLIVILQGAYFFIGFSSEDIIYDTTGYAAFQNEIDSLRQVEIEAQKPKLYPFNPNYITDFKGTNLGMNTEEIDRLLDFRKQDKWINSAAQFQEVTQISDSLFAAISPYFKFPEWVTNPKPKIKTSTYTNNAHKTFAQKQDLNTATAQQLQQVNGVGEVLSERIVKFRNKFPGGFIADVQLQDVYGLTPEVIARITNIFTVKTPRNITKINLNTATVGQLVTIQHIDYDLAYRIVEQRKLRDGFSSLNELEKVKDFPINKFDIIKLYLSLD